MKQSRSVSIILRGQRASYRIYKEPSHDVNFKKIASSEILLTRDSNGSNRSASGFPIAQAKVTMKLRTGLAETGGNGRVNLRNYKKCRLL